MTDATVSRSSPFMSDDYQSLATAADAQGRRRPGPSPSPSPSPSSSPVAAAPTRTSPARPDIAPAPTRTSPAEQTPAHAVPAAKEVLPRDFVRLFQCHVCSHPLREPVGLPCGNTMCKGCIPRSHMRVNISYPALPTRLRGFRCPFDQCAHEHALDDCAVDVLLNKTATLVQDELDRAKANAANGNVSTRIVKQDAWAIAGVSSLRDSTDSAAVRHGGRLVATFELAEDGDLEYGADVSYEDMPPRVALNSHESITNESATTDGALVKKVREAIRGEMDCQVCYALFYDPLTTSCGHTFCRSCLHRIFYHSNYCPICRRQLAINSPRTCPPNDTLTRIIKTFWFDELRTRKDLLAAERAGQVRGYDSPLFICTLAFPSMPTFLHVFEPGYRLMLRRALEGDRTFGMVLPRHSQGGDDPAFHELGTLLRIVNVQYYPDGRSLIETVGLSRFRVVDHSFVEGYPVAKTERLDDMSLQEEEAAEAAEAIAREGADEDEDEDEDSVTNGVDDGHDGDEEGEEDGRDEGGEADKGDEHGRNASPSSGGAGKGRRRRRHRLPTSLADIHTMSTQSLFHFASSFVRRMRHLSVPWLTERMLSIYGECPEDASIFPWWFASMLPIKDMEKYRLIASSSVRERLKICCSWIIEWETSRWSLHGCTVL